MVLPYARVWMLIGVASHATDHESSANRRKNLEIYEKATLHGSKEHAYIRARSHAAVFACALVRARTRITLASRVSRASERADERVVGTGRKRPEDRVQVYKGSWKGGDLPRSPFIQTAAFSVSLPGSPRLFSFSFAASRISRLRSFLLLSTSRPASSFVLVVATPRLTSFSREERKDLISLSFSFSQKKKKYSWENSNSKSLR